MLYKELVDYVCMYYSVVHIIIYLLMQFAVQKFTNALRYIDSADHHSPGVVWNRYKDVFVSLATLHNVYMHVNVSK